MPRRLGKILPDRMKRVHVDPQEDDDQ
jgi:hypothetical protein